MEPTDLYNKFKNLSFHNLCENKEKIPPLTNKLLGLGHKFCIQHPLQKNHLKNTYIKFINSMRLKYWLWSNNFNNEDDNENYIPKIYIPSGWTPPKASKDTEIAVSNFLEEILKLNNSQSRKHSSNLSFHQNKILNNLQVDNDLIVCISDKNLGPAVTERNTYIKKGFTDHLYDKKTYTYLTLAETHLSLLNNKKQLEKILRQHSNSLSLAEKTYFQRSLYKNHRIPQLYLNPKVHKQTKNGEWKTRPVISCCGSYIEIYSKWIDYHLQKLKNYIPSYLKDSFTLLDDLNNLPPLPLQAKLGTIDAKSMYTNIDTDHAIHTLKSWFQKYHNELPLNFPTEMILKCLNIVMKNNIFQFGDTHWKQNTGTAMGTSCACMYATIYYAYHERNHLLKKYKNNIIYYRRYIDDIFVIWNPIPTPHTWENFTNELTYGTLEWAPATYGKRATFLDLNLWIHNNKIETKTHQKELNLYLYIPPTSSHPPATLKGLIHGSLRRFWKQCSNPTDYQKLCLNFHTHLQNRGHNKKELDKYFLSCASSLDKKLNSYSPNIYINQEEKQSTLFTEKTVLYHTTYHPHNIPRPLIQKTFKNTCGHLGFTKNLIVCYHRPKNIRDILIPSNLPTLNKNNPSEYLNQFR